VAAPLSGLLELEKAVFAPAQRVAGWVLEMELEKVVFESVRSVAATASGLASWEVLAFRPVVWRKLVVSVEWLSLRFQEQFVRVKPG
jgi:hypothetical protein